MFTLTQLSRLQLHTCLAIALVTLSIPTASAYKFANYNLHLQTRFGSSFDQSMKKSELGRLITDLAQSRDLIYGVNVDVGPFYTKYNQAPEFWVNALEQLHLFKINPGIELGYHLLHTRSKPTTDLLQELNQSYHFNLSTSQLQSITFNQLTHYYNVGLMTRFYINQAVYFKPTLGLSWTHQSSDLTSNLNDDATVQQYLKKVTSDRAVFPVSDSYLLPYASIALGYDIGELTTALLLNYNFAKNNSVAKFSYSIQAGISYNFKFE